jgi:energy-coupling factor transporter ATP-binding protein EcfA2
MLILEGPDGAGKSTLANLLSRDLRMEIAPKVVDSDTKPMVDLAQWVEDNLKKGFHRTLYDRHRLFSEPIYGMLFREDPWPPMMDLHTMNRWWSHLQVIDPVIVYCLPTFSTVLANTVNDDNNRTILPKIRHIYAAYTAQAAVTNTQFSDCFIYDYSHGGYTVLRDAISRTFQERRGAHHVVR